MDHLFNRKFVKNKRVAGFTSGSKMLWGLATLLGLYVYLVGVRIPAFSLITIGLMVVVPFLYTEYVGSKRQNKKKEKNRGRSYLRWFSTAAIYLLLLVVCYEFVFYSVLTTQVQLKDKGYTVVRDVRVNAEGNGLTMIGDNEKVGKGITYSFSGWKLRGR